MTGFKKDPLRPTSEEERLDEEFSKGLIQHHELLGREGVNTGYASAGLVPPDRVTAEPRSTPAQQSVYATTDYGMAGAYAVTRTQQHLASGRDVVPRVHYQDVSTGATNLWATPGHPESYKVPGEFQRYTGGLPEPAPGQTRMFKGLAWDLSTGAPAVPGGRVGPEMTPPEQAIRQALVQPPTVPTPNQALADRLGGLRPAAPQEFQGAIESREATAQRVGAGISRALGLPSESLSLGNLQFREDPQRGLMPTKYVDPETGQINVESRHIQGAQQALQATYQGVMKQGAAMDPKMLSQNLTRALGETAQQYVKSVEEEGKKLAGGDAGSEFGARAVTNRVRQMVGKIAYAIVDQTEKAQGGAGGADIQRGAQRMGFEDLKRMAGGEFGPAAQGAAQAAVAQVGGWGQAAAGGVSGGGPGTGAAAFSVAGAGGSGYVPGGALGGAGGDRGGGRRGMWEGQLGGLMYGAYIAKRFWSYTGAPAMRAMEEYAGVQAGLEPMMTGEVPQGGPGSYAAQKSIGQYMLGQGAYNIVGGAMGLSSQAMQAPGMGTAAAGAGLFGGAALGARILGSSMSGMGGFAGRAGGFLKGAAGPLAIAGTAVTAMQVGQELYGAQTGRDVNTFGMIGAAGQTVARTLGGISAGVGYGVSSLLGREDEYAARFGEHMETSAYGQWLGSEMGVKRVGSGMASAGRVAEIAGQLNVAPGDISQTLAGAIGMTGEQGLEGQNLGLVTTMNKLMQTRGVSASGATALMGGYAEAVGYLPGEQGFGQAADMFGGMGVAQQSQMMQAAQRRAGQAGQFRQVISREAVGEVALRSMMGAFDTQQTGQIAFGGVSGLVAGGMGQQQALALGIQGGMAVAGGQMTQNQFQGGMGMATMMGDYMGPSAVRSGQIMQAFGQMGQGQMDLAGRIAGGDLGAMSFAANTGALPGFEGMALTDLSGAPTQMGNLQQGMLNLNQVAGQMGLGPGGQYAGAPGMDNLSQFMQLYQGAGGGGAGMGAGLRGIGVSETMSSFFEQNQNAGLTDYQREFSDKQFGNQMAGIGVGFERIALQRQFQYGGGDWRNPSADSLWGIQDRMRSLQWQGQQASAAFSLERMDVGNQFAMQQEDLSGRRMGAQQDYQRWGMGFQRAGMDLSRQFTMENRQYQDQLRGMSTAFTMEDFDENIRMSSGRQRRQMVTQRERFVSMTNVQDEQTERGREQQEELWAREDEQFEKKREYMEQTIALDEEQFNMNIERRETLFEMDRGDLERRIELAEQLHELQDEQMEKQREYAVAQMDLAEKALGIQAASAIAQKEYNDDMLIVQQDIFEKISGDISTIAQNDPIPMLNALTDMAIAINKMGTLEAKALEDLANTVGGLNSGGIRVLIRDLQTLMATSGYGG